MAAVLSESVLDQNGPKWSKRPFWSKWPSSELDFSIRETKMDQNGPFLVHLGPPTAPWPFLNNTVTTVWTQRRGTDTLRDEGPQFKHAHGRCWNERQRERERERARYYATQPLDQFAAYFFSSNNLFCLLGGKEEDLMTTKNAFLARFAVHFLGHFWL